ncbi:hypothetical protein XENORESO_015897, partial [Xenotaenia resolanae]
MEVSLDGKKDKSEPLGPSCLSMKSDRSKKAPPVFSNEPGPSEPRGRKRSGVCLEEQMSCCAWCQNVLKDPVSNNCGHWFCRQCIASYWDQFASKGHSSCPQCGKRFRSSAGQQTANQSSSAHGKTFLLICFLSAIRLCFVDVFLNIAP